MDKFVLVVGANSEIGNEVVKSLIADNYFVFAADKNYENKKFGNLVYLDVDLENDRSIENTKKNILKYTTSLFAIIYVNNYYSFSSLIEVEESDLKISFEKNFFGVYRANKVFWTLLNHRDSKIIIDCSDSSVYPLAPFDGVYSLPKTLLSNYCDVLRRELKSKGINVIKINSNYINNELSKKILDDYLKSADNSKYFYQDMIRLKEINTYNDSNINIADYCNLILGVLRRKRTKSNYFLGSNKFLKLLKGKTISKQDNYFIKYK